MSARVFSGYHILMDAHGRITDGVFAVLPEIVRAQAEAALGREWSELERDGYKLVAIEGWSIP